MRVRVRVCVQERESSDVSVCICAQRGELEGPLWICGCDVGPAALPVGIRAFENAGRLRHERERQDFERNRMEGRVPVAICGVAGLELPAWPPCRPARRANQGEKRRSANTRGALGVGHQGAGCRLLPELSIIFLTGTESLSLSLPPWWAAPDDGQQMSQRRRRSAGRPCVHRVERDPRSHTSRM